MVEMLDIYDENLVKIGVKPRPDVHRDGDWHRVFHCWVVGADYVILQKRSATKDTFPDMLDISAAGHYEAGETIEDGLREVHEELGLDVTFADLTPVGRRVSIARDSGVIDRQVADVFLCYCDQPLADYDYQRDEIDGLLSINIEQGIALLAGERDSIMVPAVGFETDEVRIDTESFIPTIDHYFFKILLLAQRYLNGEKYLFI